jgi:transposase
MAKRVHSAEFKREAVRLAANPALSRREAAKQLGIHPNVLRAWQEKFKGGKWEEKPGTDLKSAQAKEIERLKRELAEARMERDILKKAAAYFAKESK